MYIHTYISTCVRKLHRSLLDGSFPGRTQVRVWARGLLSLCSSHMIDALVLSPSPCYAPMLCMMDGCTSHARCLSVSLGIIININTSTTSYYVQYCTCLFCFPCPRWYLSLWSAHAHVHTYVRTYRRRRSTYSTLPYLMHRAHRRRFRVARPQGRMVP
jgi:hypothetical protein